MVTKNEHTGDLIQTKGGVSDKYKEGWDRIFGKKKEKQDEQVSTSNPDDNPDGLCAQS